MARLISGEQFRLLQSTRRILVSLDEVFTVAVDHVSRDDANALVVLRSTRRLLRSLAGSFEVAESKMRGLVATPTPMPVTLRPGEREESVPEPIVESTVVIAAAPPPPPPPREEPSPSPPAAEAVSIAPDAHCLPTQDVIVSGSSTVASGVTLEDVENPELRASGTVIVSMDSPPEPISPAAEEDVSRPTSPIPEGIFGWIEQVTREGDLLPVAALVSTCLSVMVVTAQTPTAEARLGTAIAELRGMMDLLTQARDALDAWTLATAAQRFSP